MDLKDVLSGMTPEMKSSVEKNQGLFQRQIFSQLARSLAGKIVYKEKSFDTAEEVVKFLNINKHQCVPVSILSNFQRFSYVLIYEESNG